MLTDEEYKKEEVRLEKLLIPKITDEFLKTLVEAAKTYGWNGDHIETDRFVNYCFFLVGEECPDLEPYL